MTDGLDIDTFLEWSVYPDNFLKKQPLVQLPFQLWLWLITLAFRLLFDLM